MERDTKFDEKFIHSLPSALIIIFDEKGGDFSLFDKFNRDMEEDCVYWH